MWPRLRLGPVPVNLLPAGTLLSSSYHRPRSRVQWNRTQTLRAARHQWVEI
jgi:hypothetical protein